MTHLLRIPRFVQIGFLLSGLAQAQPSGILSVESRMDIYRAGDYNDGSDGIAPAIFSFEARAGRTLSFSSVNGTWKCGHGDTAYGPDGTASRPCFPTANIANPVGPFSGYSLTDFTGGMVGVFLEDAIRDSAPAPLRFYANDRLLKGIQTDFLTLSPRIGQVFFIGDGLTGTAIGSLQTFHVPPTATHLYLGYAESCGATGHAAPGCYSNNRGSLTAIFNLVNHALEWVEPRLTTSSPSARYGSGLAYDAATGSTVFFGGITVSEIRYADTWIWKNGWFQLSPANAPSPRGGESMVYDPAAGSVLLFGGNTASGDVNDTWTWDGVTWTQQFPPVSPPPRDTAGMTYDAANGTVLLFGGSGDINGDGNVLSDTWVWNGKAKTWTQRFPASSPSARRTRIAYDRANGNVVLFGGDTDYYGGDVFFNDTWTWDGVTWTQRYPASSPSVRALNTLTYDPDIGRVLLFGGYAGSALQDTWTWDGLTWKQLRFANEPEALWYPAIDFDPHTGGLVRFGGVLTGLFAVNDTWLFKSVPVR